MPIPFLYQLQGASQDSLASQDFEVGVVDMDDTGMSRSEVDEIEAQGKTLLTYVSIGEAEDYRDYWSDVANQDYILGENPDWDGNYRVKFWDPEWQEIMLDRVTEAVEKGYSGMYLDIVDGYLVDEVRAAYDGSDIRQEMVDFVIRLSEHAKSLDPDFKVIPQNAVELLAVPGGSEIPNTEYLSAIDGVGVEDLFYDDNTPADWSRWDIEYIRHAQQAGKFVLATSYPTEDGKQADFIEKALAEGFVPFVGTRSLDGTVDPVNETIDVTLPPDLAATDATSGGSTEETTDGSTGNTETGPSEETSLHEIPTMPSEPDFFGLEVVYGSDSSETLRGNAVAAGGGSDTVKGTRKADVLAGGDGLDTLYGHQGGDKLFGQGGHDELRGGRGDDQLSGGKGHDQLFGGADNDLLFGGPGYDELRGGDGDDWLVADELDTRIDGGSGFDTLETSGDTFVFDKSVVDHIEAVDLRGEGATSLVVDAAEVRGSSDDGRLFVWGDAGDAVTGSGWTEDGVRTIDGQDYAAYESDGIELLVQNGLTMNGAFIDIA